MRQKLVVNIMGGSAYVINDWSDCADAILMSFYSGIEGGNALADNLSGDSNFGGKLPFTVAKKQRIIPIFSTSVQKTRKSNTAIITATLF